MEVIVMAFALGVLVLQQAARLPDAVAGLAAGGAAALALVLSPGLARIGWPGGRWAGWVLAVLAAFVLGGSYGAWRAELRLAEALPEELEGQDVRVTGVIASMPQDFERGVRFVFQVEQADRPVPARISLAWYRGFHEDEWHARSMVHAGERWTLTLRLKRPHGNVNPHGFDYEAWLLEQGIRATGYVRPLAPLRRDAFVPGLMNGVERWREGVRERFRAALPGAPYAGVLVALAVGDQRAITPEQWRSFARSGITHLVAISGLHVTLFAAMFALVFSAAWRRVPALALRVPAQQAGLVAGFVGAAAYCVLAGWGVPAQRTLYMLGCAALALVLRRDTAPGRVLAVALLVVLLMDPWAVSAAGFWLSFGAVGLLFLVSSGRLGADRWRDALRAQGAVTLGMVPALLVLFQQFSLVSPLANAIAIPLVSFVVTPLAVGFALVPIQILADLAHHALVFTLIPVEWLANLPYAVWQQAMPPPALAVLATAGCLWALLPAGTPARWVGVLPLIPLVLWVPPRPEAGAAQITILDVGQGLAVHVQTATHDLIYDTGPAFSAEVNSGERILLPYLRAAGVRRLDELIVTHQDNDHAGGAESVLTGIPVARVRSSLPARHPARLIAGARHQPCVAGQSWVWDGVRMDVLHPGEPAGNETPLRSNDLACVLRLVAAGRSVLLTSDIEALSEREMLKRFPDGLASEVVVVPHHGSRTSSTPAFLAATRPGLAIFPVGYRNRFNHPNPAVWARWEGTGADLWRTDEAGAVIVRMDADGIEVSGARQQAPRYWYGR